jgi:hypothetical protein
MRTRLSALIWLLHVSARPDRSLGETRQYKVEATDGLLDSMILYQYLGKTNKKVSVLSLSWVVCVCVCVYIYSWSSRAIIALLHRHQTTALTYLMLFFQITKSCFTFTKHMRKFSFCASIFCYFSVREFSIDHLEDLSVYGRIILSGSKKSVKRA